MSRLTKGTQIYFLDTSGTTPEVVKVECATSFNPGGDPAGEIDDTCLDSKTMEYVAGMRNPGSATLGIRPDPDSASHITMFALSRMDPSPVIQWAVGWSDGTAAPTYGSPVDAVTVDAGGTGYSAPTVTFSAPEDPNGTTATGVATVDAGVITGITITDPGSGYQAAPTVTITGAGSGATASATLGLASLVYPDTRTWTTMPGYISDYPFDFQVNALVTGDVSIKRTGGLNWIKKAAA